MSVVTRLLGAPWGWFILRSGASVVISMVIGRAKGLRTAAGVLCECSILIMFCVQAKLLVSGGGGFILIPFYGL